MLNRNLKSRILEISLKYGLTHLGSTLTSCDIIDDIYQTKKKNEMFFLSCGHAGIALYAVIEKYEKVDAESIYLHHGIHPDRCDKCHLHFSSGSLGHGLSQAVGLALSNRSKNVYCLISDGELFEGSIYEAANVINKYKVDNIKVFLNYNHWGAYDPISPEIVENMRVLIPNIRVFNTNFNDYPFLKGQDAHYYKLTKEDYEEFKVLK
jgi:transketolase